MMSLLLLLLLFLSAFISATLFPLASEGVLLALLQEQVWPLAVIWLTASVGNTLGACVNWLLGRYLLHFQGQRWFPFQPQKLQHSQQWFQRYGSWSLLFAWLPLVGDGLTFIAGVMRLSFVPFILLVFLGKSARYAAVIYLWLQA